MIITIFPLRQAGESLVIYLAHKKKPWKTDVRAIYNNGVERGDQRFYLSSELFQVFVGIEHFNTNLEKFTHSQRR